MGRLAHDVLAAVVQWERREFARRASIRGQLGLCVGNTKLGECKVERDGLQYTGIDEHEADKLAKVRGWRAEGLTHREVQERCIAEGIVTRKGAAPSLGAIGSWVRGVELPPKPAERLKATSSKGKGRKAGTRGPRTEDRNATLRALLKSYIDQGLTQAKMTQLLAESGVRNSKGNPYNKQQVQRFVSRIKADCAVATERWLKGVGP